MRVMTRRCHERGHPELELDYDPARLLARDAEWFAEVLEGMVHVGSRFEIGQSLQIGWSLAWFTRGSSPGVLGFEEPDMRSMPIVREPGLTHSLSHLRFQKDTLQSVLPADALAFPSLLQSCLVCSRVELSPAFFMDRNEPNGADSGWFIGCCDEEHDHNQLSELEKVSVYEAVIRRCGGALQYLAFPAGAMIVVDEWPEFFMNGKELEIRSGSFVDATLNARFSSDD
jgi:hypothetical protein